MYACGDDRDKRVRGVLRRSYRDTKPWPRATPGVLADVNERESTRQHFPLDLVQDHTPVLVVVWIPSAVLRPPLNLDGPSCFNVCFGRVEARKQLRRETGTFVPVEFQRILKQLLSVRRHDNDCRFSAHELQLCERV